MNWRERLRATPPRNEDLSPRQAEVLTFIMEFKAEHGLTPSLREIGAELGISSTNGVNDHMIALERKGFLTIHHAGSHSKSRTIVFTERALHALHGPPCTACGGTGRIG